MVALRPRLNVPGSTGHCAQQLRRTPLDASTAFLCVLVTALSEYSMGGSRHLSPRAISSPAPPYASLSAHDSSSSSPDMEASPAAASSSSSPSRRSPPLSAVWRKMRDGRLFRAGLRRSDDGSPRDHLTPAATAPAAMDAGPVRAEEGQATLQRPSQLKVAADRSAPFPRRLHLSRHWHRSA